MSNTVSLKPERPCAVAAALASVKGTSDAVARTLRCAHIANGVIQQISLQHCAVRTGSRNTSRLLKLFVGFWGRTSDEGASMPMRPSRSQQSHELLKLRGEHYTKKTG